MLEIIILGLTAALNLLLGVFVYLKNSKGSTNRFFLLLTSSFVLWSVVSYLSVHPIIFSQLTWIRLVLFCGALLNLSVFLSFLAFPATQLDLTARKWAKRVVWVTLFVMPLTLTPLVFKELSFESGSAQPVPNPGIALFLLHTVGLIGASIALIIRKFMTTHGRVRNQLKLILLGIAGTFGLIIVTNFLLVVIFNITALIPFGPAFTLLFSSSFAYAIIKHKLFDLRAAIARSFAYLLSLGSLGLVYGVLAFGISSSFLDDTQVEQVERVFYVGFALITALLYRSTKGFFDRITNKLFYRDAYDPQVFLNQLNETLVSNIELGILLRHATRVIEDNIKCEFCLVGIAETGTQPWRVMGTTDHRFSQEDSRFIRSELSLIGKKLVLSDDLGSSQARLKSLLEQNNIAVVTSLITHYESQEHATAYLMLGPKKSGNIYNKQDLRILEIIANELLIAIQNALRFEEIEEFNVTLQSRINEATGKLQKTNEKLKELDETKDEFISMASHQLRTPLTSVKGYLSMVIEGDAGKLNDMQRDLLGQAFSSSQRMVYLIADLLNASRLKTGKFIIDAQPTDLRTVVKAEIGQLKEAARAKKIKLTYQKSADFPTLMLDETKTRQVIMNFVDNAIYYTPAGGKIAVELTADKSNVYFMVKDNGLGVPKEEQGRLFAKFYRASNAQKVRPDGTGLGLFMAKKVVNAQGGTIVFESEEGKGSTFGFAFEKSKLAPKE